MISVYTVHGFERTPDGSLKLPLRYVMKDLIHPNTPEGARKYMAHLRGSLLLVSGRYKRYVKLANSNQAARPKLRVAPTTRFKDPKMPGKKSTKKVPASQNLPAPHKMPDARKSHIPPYKRLCPGKIWALSGGSVINAATPTAKA